MTARSGMADLITRLRGLVNDKWQLKQDTATGDGSTDVFWLRHNPQASGGTVSVAGTAQGTAAYAWDVTYGRLDFTTAPANSAAVVVEYQHARWTNDELEDALDQWVTHVESQPLAWLPDSVSGGSIEYHRAALGYRDVEGTASGTIYWTLLDTTGSAAPAYTLDPITGQVRFTADTKGTAYYWTGRSYDLWQAAADLWEQRAAELSDWYSFEAGDQKHERQQAFQQAREMAKQCRGRGGQNRQRGSLQTGAFVRTDLNPRA